MAVGVNVEVRDAKAFADKEAWRDWLAANHGKANHAWLFIQKKNMDGKGIEYQNALEEALCFGWIDGKLHSYDDESYILRFSPRRPRSLWSKINKEKVKELMASGRMTEAGNAKIRAAKKNGNWAAAYSSKEKQIIPPDLEKALKKMPEGYAHFKAFTNSQQSMYIGWVVGAKRNETRLRRIREVVERSRKDLKPGI